MRALVTGAAGFIGSHVAEHLLREGLEVIALDDLSGGFADNVPEGATFVQGSINDRSLLDTLFEKHGFDYVFHLAAYAAEGLSPFIRRFNYENNLIGSINLINLSVIYRIKCFVFTSSIAVYGSAPPPMTEDTTPRPEDPYGIAKYAVELDLRAAHHQFGLPYVIFRAHNVYGSRQNIGDRYRNVVGIFMNQVLRGGPLTVFGDGQQTRAFSHIDDVAPVIARSIQCPEVMGEVFNIGGDVAISVNELAEVVMAALDRQVPIKHLRSRQEVKDAYASHEKAARVFGGKKKVSIEDGVRQMAEWVKVVGSRAAPAFENIEIREGLPEGWSGND
jgi:UDP-glucose 4-epimerase